MKSVLAKQEAFNNTTAESKNIDIQQLSAIMKQTKYFSDISDNEKMLNDKMKKVIDAMSEDKKIQVASVLEAAKTDKDMREDDKNLQDKVDKLVKLFDKSSSNLQKLVTEAKKQTKGFEKLTANSAKEITDKAMGQPQYKTIGERIGDVKDKVKNFFSVKGFLNSTGIVDKDSKGIIATAINKRQDRMDYVEDRMKVDPNLKNLKQFGGDEKKVREYLAKQFDQQQDIKKDMRANEKSIQQFKDRGYTDAQIKRTGLLDTRNDLAVAYAKADPRVRDAVEKVTNKSTSTTSKEAAQEQQDAISDQMKIFETIAENTAETNRILLGAEKKSKKEEKKEEKSSGFLDSIKDTFGKFKIPGMGKVAKGAAGLARGAAGFMAGGGAAAAGTAAMVAAPWLADSALGAMGVGKDKDGKDLVINTKQDDRNWERASMWEKIQSMPARGIEKIGGLFGGNIAREATAKRIESETKYLDDKYGKENVAPISNNKVNKNNGVKKSESYIKIANERYNSGDELSDKQMAAINIATAMGGAHYPDYVMQQYNKQNSEKVKVSTAASGAEPVYNDSAKVQSMKENGAVQTAPVVVAPSTINNNNTQVTKFDMPIRKNDDSLNRYTGSRLAY